MSDHITHLLPDEIVEEIILKLPSKPLIRFKSLSKTWCSLITTPHFLANHLLPDRRDDGKVLLVKRSHKNNIREIIFSLLSHHKLTPARLLPYPQPEQDPEELSPPISISGPWLLPYPNLPVSVSGGLVSILGPINGLVCLFDDTDKVHILLWNLLDGEVKVLPDSRVPDPDRYEPSLPVLGFGYDVETRDFKVIRISALVELEEHPTSGYHKVEVYSSNADTWKGYDKSDLKFCFDVGLCRPIEAYLDGVMTWRAIEYQFDYDLEQDRCENFILWFRMSDESIGKIPLPGAAEIESVNGPFGEYGYDGWWGRLLFVLNDKTVAFVAFVAYDLRLDGKEVCFHVWALLEFGVEASWTKLFTVGPLTGIRQPLWFWNTGSMIMETTEGELVLYNPFIKETTSLNIHGLRHTFQIISIEESFIL